MTTQKVPDDMTFEQALGRLEAVVSAMESGDLPLSEATNLYEDGMKLARVCSEMLAAAELKITKIQTAYGEQMRLPPEPGG
jgi:exodeoxyribonuclease VII small subunit